MYDERQPLYRTGLFTSDYIIGLNKAKGKNFNFGTIIQVRFDKDCYFPPTLESIDDEFIEGLEYGYLSTIGKSKRVKFLKKNSTRKEIYLSDLKLELRFITLTGVFSTLDNVSELTDNNWIQMKDLFDSIPGGKKTSRRHSLIFRPSIWALYDGGRIEEPDYYFDLLNCSFEEERTQNRVCIVKIGKYNIGVCDEDQGELPKINKKIKNKLNWFTPAIHKSLIQKCIRMYAENVQIDDELFDTIDVLKTSFLMLMEHPGSFVPDIKMFVKGSESALKRFAVAIMEDSSLTRKEITSLLFAALAARKNFIFSTRYIEQCLNWLEESLSERCYEYHYESTGKKLKKKDRIVCDLLKELGSLGSDHTMVLSICEYGWTTITDFKDRPKIMNIVHCLDQHCTTQVIHFYQYGSDIKKIIHDMWHKSSGFNPRKHTYKISKKIENAQLNYWKLKSRTPIKTKITTTKIEYKKNIDSSWISGIIGPMKNNVKINGRKTETISFFHPEDLSNIVTIRKPSRAKDQEELTDEQLEECAKNIREEKSSKFHLKEEAIGIDNNFKCVEDEFYIYTEEGKQRWIDFCDSEEKIRIGEYESNITFDEIIESISTISYNCINSNWESTIVRLLDEMESTVIFRLAMYIRVVTTRFGLYKISRDGTGVYQSVNDTDIDVFKFLCYCCYLLPIVISIEKRNEDVMETTSIMFEITNLFFWNKIRHLVFDKISKIKLYNWEITKEDERELKEYQTESVEKIIDRSKFGKRGNIMWMPVGTGKTLIVMESLYRLSKMTMLTKYVIYTLPPETIKSVVKEFKMFGIPYNVCDFTKATKIKKYHVNFIKHDQLRRDEVKEFLIEKSADIFLVLDEFHKMMSIETQRTSIALEISKLCNNFIAMTGTLIKGGDNSEQGIIEWVSQIVEFELTKKNYLVGISMLISRKINLGIEEVRTNKMIKMTNEEYYSYVTPKFGGAASKVDFRNAIRICYDIIKYSLIKYGLKVLKKEKYVFIVALNKEMQNWISQEFLKLDIESFCISGNNPILLTPDMDVSYRVIITTMSFSTGYTITACKTMIQSVYFSNQATRTQMLGRICRMGQPSNHVDIITLHTGLLSYIYEKYEDARSVECAMKDLAKEI